MVAVFRWLLAQLGKAPRHLHTAEIGFLHPILDVGHLF